MSDLCNVSVRRVLLALCSFIMLGSAFAASPWLDTGDAALRNDVQLLADFGVVRSPVTTWPVSASDIAVDVLNENVRATLPKYVQAAFDRVRAAVQEKMQAAPYKLSARIAIGSERNVLRGFQDSPRAESEFGVQAEGMSSRFAYRLKITQAVNPEDDVNQSDDRDTRLDGSYLAASLGNWMVGVGSQNRWWGPGWDGSLILSNNARPVPSLFFQRNRSTPFKTRWLSWIGPWQFVGFLGQLESERAVSDARLFGLRFSFKPTPNLEIGLSRTAQWAGDGRPSDADSFFKLLVGNDNSDGEDSTENEPGNQLAGYDLRYSFRGFGLPLAFYTQLIGEDEAGGLPAKFIGQVGFDGWFGVTGSIPGVVRWRVEYADTATNFQQSDPRFNTAYEHSTYRSGYRYYRRSIGHTIDNDSRQLTLGLIFTPNYGPAYELVLRNGEFNRDANVASSAIASGDERGNTRSTDAADFYGADWTINWQIDSAAKLALGISYLRIDGISTNKSETVPYVEWSQAF